MSNWSVVNLLTFFPIIGVLFLLWIILRASRSVTSRINLNRRLYKWIICSYVGILFLAIVVYLFLPRSGNELMTKTEYEAFKKENETFESAFSNAEGSKLDQKFLLENSIQELDGDTLEVGLQGSSRPKLNIEWTDSKEQAVEVEVYHTNVSVYGINLKGEIPLSTIDWKGNQLIVKEPAQQELKYYQFIDGLVWLSFLEDSPEREYTLGAGNMYIYLKVPKHINVIDKDGLQFY